MSKTGKAAVGSGGRRTGGGPRLGPHTYFTPVALGLQKRGRLCVVGKLTRFVGSAEPILGVAWRSQQGTKAAISLPVVAIEYAKRHGATQFYLRDDRGMTMLTCDLGAFERGRLRSDGELYVPLSWLAPVPWRDWEYARQVVDLTPRGKAAAQQLVLPGLEAAYAPA